VLWVPAFAGMFGAGDAPLLLCSDIVFSVF
jgi:hypothetical protein